MNQPVNTKLNDLYILAQLLEGHIEQKDFDRARYLVNLMKNEIDERLKDE
jgi:pentatricopeptide repeat protein